MKTVLGYLRPYAGRAACGVLIKFSAAVLELILPLLLANVIDVLVPARDLPAIWRTGGLMLVLAFGAAAGNILANRMAARVSMEMTRDLRRDLYHQIQHLPCARADRYSASSLVSRLTNDTYNIHQMFDKIQRGGVRAPMLVLGAVAYTLQLYFNFSGYSEVARAVGLFLGLNLPENFKTPFFATNFSGFWSRWHISFSSWLQDYLFMPLAWADLSGVTRGKLQRLPAEVCVFTVFFVSGFWHGNTLPFVVWGLLQACYRLGEELLHRRFGKPKKKAPARVVRAKRAVVFVLWTVSMVFFRVGSAGSMTVGDAFGYLAGWFRGWAPARFAGELYSAVYTAFYANPIMVAAYYAFVVLTLVLAFYLDTRRAFTYKNKPSEIALAGEKHRWVVYYLLVVCLLAGYIMQSGGFGNAGFGMYAGF